MKRILLLVFWCSVSLWADAQALLGTTGLLHAPTADMQRDKTFLFGGNYLNTHPLSTHFRSSEVGYTFNYYINITIFPWLEVSYICTLVHADHGSTYFPEQSWGKFTNQDRAFSARLRLWKEGWWKEWTPQIVLGLDDPTSHADHGGGGLVSGNTSGSNNYATRYYLAVTKHLDVQNIGEWGIHAAFVYLSLIHILRKLLPKIGHIIQRLYYYVFIKLRISKCGKFKLGRGYPGTKAGCRRAPRWNP